MKIIQSLF